MRDLLVSISFVALGVLPLHAYAQITPLSTAAAVPGIDFIIESDSYVPGFYSGRAEPTIGSRARVIATSQDLLLDNVYYQWSIDGRLSDQEPVLHKQSIIFTIPRDREVQIGLRMFDENNNVIAEQYENIPIRESELVFYEVNPLRGNGRTAIIDTHILTGEEVTFKAEPFFINKNLLTIPEALQWSLEGTVVENTSSDPLTLTVIRDGEDSGTTKVGLVLRDFVSYAQKLTGEFTFNY